MYFKGGVSNVFVFVLYCVLFLRFVSTVTGIGGVEVPQVSTVTGTVGVRVTILVPVVAVRPSTLLELLFFFGAQASTSRASWSFKTGGNF